MEENEEVQVEEAVVPQEETTEEVTETEGDSKEDVITLKGEDKTEYEAYLAKKAKREPYIKPKSLQPKKEYNVTADKLERMELKLDGYTGDEVEAIMELGGSKALSNPLVKGAIETMRAKAKSQESNQPLNSKSPVFKKFTQADLNGMTSAELEAILPKD